MDINLLFFAAPAVASLLVLIVVLLQKKNLQQVIDNQQQQLLENTRLLDRLGQNEEKSMLQQQQLQQLISESQHSQQEKLADFRHHLSQLFADLKESLLKINNEHRSEFSKAQLESLNQLLENLNKASQMNREELAKAMQANAELIAKQMGQLTETTDNKLKEIGGQVEKRLTEGFEKTTQTFNDILKRLALIDDAQKKITELSTNVVSLQEVLADKRSRGAFGEVQLSGLIRNVLPEQHFSLQHTLSNGKIADCVLFLPEPTGNVVIDSKFPLESYQRMMDNNLGDADRLAAERQFKQDIKKHIKDISEKYLIENETSDGALMFIPAEAIFAEIHAHLPELVEEAYQKRVWLASPTTLMAILTTARSVIKDEATRKQVHIIQDHLVKLGADFGRFKTRFDNLAKHIDQAASDVKQIHTSADKISSRFNKIEQVDLSDSGLENLAE